MAFSNVQIVSTRNGIAPITGWRQDLAIGDVIAMQLTDTTGVSSFRWELVGRPEGSLAGGSGPEPILLSTGATAGFTVDDDSVMIRDGTYIVHCTLNGGAPTDTVISVGLARLVPGLSFNGLPLRKLGGFESLEDTQDTLTKQGWAKMLDRWLGVVQTSGGGGGGGSVANWDVTKVRYFFVDGDMGDDSHVGYIDAAPGTDFTSQMILVASVAIKTTSRLKAITPLNGAGRMMVRLFKPRAGLVSYDDIAPGDGLGSEDRSLYVGYSIFHTRGSDLTNSIADRAQLGFVTTAPGPNSDESWTVSSSIPHPDGTTTIVLTSGGSSSLPDSEELTRYRIRILASGGTTVYAPVRWGDTIGAGDYALTAWFVPGPCNPGDQLWLEQPGVVIDRFNEMSSACKSTSVLQANVALAGFQINTAFTIGCSDDGTQCIYTHILVNNTTWPPVTIYSNTGQAPAGAYVLINGFYVDETGTSYVFSGLGLAGSIMNYSGGALIMQYSSVISFFGSIVQANFIDIRYSSIRKMSVISGEKMLQLAHLNYGSIEVTPSSNASIENSRGVTAWRPIIYVSGLPNTIKFSDLQNLLSEVPEAEPDIPCIILNPGQYTVIFDHGDGTTLVQGNGVMIYYDQAKTQYTLVTWDSLRTTGFDIENSQKVVCRLTGEGFYGDLLPCPRGTVMRIRHIIPS